MTTVAAARRIRATPAETCALCGTAGRLKYPGLRDHLFGVPDTWSLRSCGRCQSVWVDPRPIDDEFAAIYPDSYLTHESSGPQAKTRLMPDWATQSILAGRYGYKSAQPRALRRALGRLLSVAFPCLRELAAGEIAGLAAAERGRLLDVGCGNGNFLRTMAGLGWHVHGVEPDPAAARVAAAQLGNVIHHGHIADAPFEDGTFDVVVMKHVIEHLHNPAETLVHCRRLLRPGGKLVLLTPNARSLGGAVFGRDWLGWDVPRHIFIFSPQAIETLLGKAGFRRVRIETPGRKAARMWQMSKALRRGRMAGTVVGLNGGRATLAAVLFWVVECGLIRLWPRGEELWAMAEKPMAEEP